MANNVFISFRYSDGHLYKEKLAGLFDTKTDTIDFSEDVNRFRMTESTIKSYLYGKLSKSSVTIILLTPQALNHRKNIWGQYDDWMYDEIRYSLEDRYDNRTNGLIAVYTPQTESMLINRNPNGISIVSDVDNLFRYNMMNVKPEFKKDIRDNIYDCDYDSYCSLISWDMFYSNASKYIDIAKWKRDNTNHYNLVKRI